MARSVEQLAAWAELLTVCMDDRAVFFLTPDMAQAVIEVERELSRLHAIEAAAIRLASTLHKIAHVSNDSDEWWNLMDEFWNEEDAARSAIVALVPEAFERV